MNPMIDRVRRRLVCLGVGGLFLPKFGAAAARDLQISLHRCAAREDVRTFGVLGDGSVDDSHAIARAFAKGPRRLYFPPGTYVGSNIELNVKDRIIDAADAVFLNKSKGEPFFRVSKGARAKRLGFYLGRYVSAPNAGFLFEIDGGVLSDCTLEVSDVLVDGGSGGVLKHLAIQKVREHTEGIFFTRIFGRRWEGVGKGDGMSFINVASRFNSFSACNISVRDVRLLSGGRFVEAICEEGSGSSFNQILIHDVSIEKCLRGAVYISGARATGLVNIGFFDLKRISVRSPLISLLSSNRRSRSDGPRYYIRDVFRSGVNFEDGGCDVLSAEDDVFVQNYHAVGGSLFRSV